MLEIICKAKRVDNNEWVTGCYTEYHAYFTMGTPVIENLDYDYEVKPETVSRYIGLRDRNGNRIFEGDLLMSRRGIMYKVFWDEKTLSFKTKELYTKKVETLFNYNHWSLDEYSIIGHMCDDSDLINDYVASRKKQMTVNKDGCVLRIDGKIFDFYPDYKTAELAQKQEIKKKRGHAVRSSIKKHGDISILYVGDKEHYFEIERIDTEVKRD